jgi:hypothetical protein
VVLNGELGLFAREANNLGNFSRDIGRVFRMSLAFEQKSILQGVI